jgi:hypothetical protein
LAWVGQLAVAFARSSATPLGVGDAHGRSAVHVAARSPVSSAARRAMPCDTAPVSDGIHRAQAAKKKVDPAVAGWVAVPSSWRGPDAMCVRGAAAIKSLSEVG